MPDALPTQLGGMRERCVAEALERSGGYPWKTWPVVVTTEHPSKDGKRPWSVQIRAVPIEQDERTIIEVALSAWKRDAPHPIDLDPDDCVLRHDEGIVYLLAGFDVVGIDREPQPNYPYRFIRGDALELLADRGFMAQFDAIHASPPCQTRTAYRRKGHGVGDGYVDLVDATRAAILPHGLPYVIENVPGDGQPLLNPVQLCGSSFGLDVRRHRLFECSFPVMAPPCAHGWQTPRFAQATNRENRRSTVEVGVWRIPLDVQQRAMGIDWMTLEELSEALPPAFTEHVGRFLMRAVLEPLEQAA